MIDRTTFFLSVFSELDCEILFILFQLFLKVLIDGLAAARNLNRGCWDHRGWTRTLVKVVFIGTVFEAQIDAFQQDL